MLGPDGRIGVPDLVPLFAEAQAVFLPDAGRLAAEDDLVVLDRAGGRHAHRAVVVHAAHHGTEQVGAVAPPYGVGVPKLFQQGQRAGEVAHEVSRVLFLVVEARDAVRPCPVHVVGERPVVVRGHRAEVDARLEGHVVGGAALASVGLEGPGDGVAPSVRCRAERHDAGQQYAARPLRQARKLLPLRVVVRVHGVGRTHVIENARRDPRGYVESAVVAFLDGLRHANAQKELLALPARLVVQHVADAPEQLGHQVLAFAGDGARVREVVVAAEGYLDSVHVEAAGDLLDRPEVEVPHLLEGEVHRIARIGERPRRDVFQDEFRVVEHPPRALRGSAVVVPEPRAGDELHPPLMGAFAENLDGVDALIQHGDPAAMLGALVELVGVGAEVGDPTLSEDLLPKRVGPAQREVVYEPLDLFRRGRIAGERLARVAGKVGYEEQANIALGVDGSRSRRL